MTETRAEKAQRLVDEGRVEVWGRTDCGIGAYITDQDDERYTVLCHYGYYKCGCAKGYRLPNADDLCAHALAVKLAVAKEQTR